MVSDDWRPDWWKGDAEREGPSEDSVQEALEPETAFELLADRRRRQLLAQLAQDTTQSTVDELATALAEGQSGTEPADSVEEIKILLHHVHLPKLADVGLVHYDPQDGIVVPTATVEPLAGVSVTEREP